MLINPEVQLASNFDAVPTNEVFKAKFTNEVGEIIVQVSRYSQWCWLGSAPPYDPGHLELILTT